MLEKKIEMETMEDYHELYLKFDVLFLADVFEKIRNDSLENCGLCPSHYLIAPGLSWDAMLKIEKLKKKKKKKLELISDPDINVYFLRKLEEVEFLIFLIDIAKPTINI